MNPSLALARPGVAGLAALGSLAAHVAAAGRLDAAGIKVAACTAAAAGGALALNQVQERFADARMLRTSGRPLPAGMLSPASARGRAAGLLVLGLAGLAAVAGPLPAALAGLAVLVYNGVYTPLKRRTVFAQLAGSVSGALIPAIGWAAAGGAVDAPPLRALMVFFALWQMPHAWLLVLSRPGDHERGGFVPPMRGLARSQVARVLLVWTAAAVVSAATLPAFGLLRPLPWAACLGAGGWMIVRVLRASAEGAADGAATRKAFAAANTFALVTLLAILAGPAFRI
ncbi:MAG: UbiA family prenyltransferase [Candidatus Coatesbacteria bacterium]